jgi:hypothetical protein
MIITGRVGNAAVITIPLASFADFRWRCKVHPNAGRNYAGKPENHTKSLTLSVDRKDKVGSRGGFQFLLAVCH